MKYDELVKALRMCMERTCPFCDFFDGNGCKLGGYMKITLNAAAAIEALQAQLPKRGEWIMDGKYSRHCSICNESVAWPEKYCPNCGAKMMEVQE